MSKDSEKRDYFSKCIFNDTFFKQEGSFDNVQALLTPDFKEENVLLQ